MKSFFICLFNLLLILSLSAQDGSNEQFVSYSKKAGELRYYMLFAKGASDTTKYSSAITQTVQTKKSSVGILLSAALPGAGQFYTGSWKRGLIYLGVETAMWIFYFDQKDKGNALRTQFRAYADGHWSEEAYYGWLDENPTFTDTTHSLPATKTQQYYEMIGKYNQFKAGWDDWQEGDPALTPNRDHYESMRDKHNRYLIRASYCTMIALANHVFSAFDAAFTIRKFNRQIESKMRVHMSGQPDQIMSVLALHFCW